MNTLEKTIVAILKENTGTHFLDSGGAEGRAWQRNQNKVFKDEPRVSVEFYGNEPQFTISLYHYFCEVLELDDFTNKVNRYLNLQRKKGIDAHWAQECSELLQEKGLIEEDNEPKNTYNWDNNFSQDFLFIPFDYMDERYVLLQVHGGADIRGGYTDTKCFKCNEYFGYSPDIYGHVNGESCDTMYNGTSLTNEEGEEVEFTEEDDFSFDFYVIE